MSKIFKEHISEDHYSRLELDDILMKCDLTLLRNTTLKNNKAERKTQRVYHHPGNLTLVIDTYQSIPNQESYRKYEFEGNQEAIDITTYFIASNGINLKDLS